jgi:crossover junction endodeoxyribonuclease RuvC
MFASGDAPILGIDPGLTRCGYAVITRVVEPGQRPGVRALALGVLRTAPADPLAERLAQIHADVEALLDQFAPGAVAVEQVFFQSNVRTAMSVAQVSGVVLAAAARRRCSVVQYTPSQVKSSIAGWGGADKEQVQRMVQMRLGLAEMPKPADAADAAALALCHLAMSVPLVAARSAGVQP